MVKQGATLVVGLGEVGGALASVLDRSGPVLRHDLERREFSETIGVMHLCFPFKTRAQFESDAISYIKRFKPALTIINSTVLPGTSRAIAQQSGAAIAYSPVRGKHVRMAEHLLHYTKFISATDESTAQKAEAHFRSAGMKTASMNRMETLELAKLAETSYFGVLIAFAQELNRYCQTVSADYEEGTRFFEEVEFLPSTSYFPGLIGGHCVIPNLHLLLQMRESPLFEAVLESNRQKAIELPQENSTESSERMVAGATR